MRQERQGFTLVEMIVAVAIMIAITGLGIPSFISFSRRQSVKAVVSQVRDDAKRMQNLSQSGDKRCTCGSPATDADYTLSSWYLSFNLANRDRYTLDSKCKRRTDISTYVCATGDKSSVDPKTVTIKSTTQFASSITLENASYATVANPTQIVFAFSPSDNTVRFFDDIQTELNDYTGSPWFADRAIIQVEDKKDAAIRFKVVITKSGNIYELE